MNEDEFAQFLDKLTQQTPEQWEKTFATAWEHFRYCDDKKLERDAIAWRCKQAEMLLKHRKP